MVMVMFKKRIFSLILTIVMVVSVFGVGSLSAYAESGTETKGLGGKGNENEAHFFADSDDSDGLLRL